MPGPEPPQPRPVWYERHPWHDVFQINLGVFQALLITYLTLLLVESLREGTVSRFLNLNWILLVVLATGVTAVLTVRENQKDEQPALRKRDYALIALLAIGAWLILWYQLRALGWIQYPVSIFGGILVGLVSLSVLLPEPHEDEPEPAPEPPGEPEAPPAPPPLAPVPPEPPGEVQTVEGTSAPPDSLRFECPTCGNPGRIASERAGRLLRCPRCGTRLLVEAPQEPKPVPKTRKARKKQK